MAEPICKRCIHHDICESYSGFDIITFFPYNEECEYFKSTTDIVEARYGEWVWKELYGEVGSMLVCSECEESEGACERFDYCPNCGADMRGERNV